MGWKRTMKGLVRRKDKKKEKWQEKKKKKSPTRKKEEERKRRKKEEQERERKAQPWWLQPNLSGSEVKRKETKEKSGLIGSNGSSPKEMKKKKSQLSWPARYRNSRSTSYIKEDVWVNHKVMIRKSPHLVSYSLKNL